MTRRIATPVFNSFNILSLVIVAAISGSASADTYDHIDRLAVRIDNRAKQIVRETRQYEHTPEYGHLVSDAQAMSRLANHIHDVAHHQGDVHHLAADLRDLDSQFHHLENLIDRIEHNAAYGAGHIHGNTNRIRRLLDNIEDDIHHLQADIASLQRPVVYPVVAPTPVYVAPNPVYVAPRPVYVAPRAVYPAPRTYGGHGGLGHVPGHSGGGITIGRGNSQFTFHW